MALEIRAARKNSQVKITNNAGSNSLHLTSDNATLVLEDGQVGDYSKSIKALVEMKSISVRNVTGEDKANIETGGSSSKDHEGDKDKV